MYRVDITAEGDYLFNVKAKGGSIAIDAKGEKGITPPDALLAGLASCVGVYVRKYAEGAKIALGEYTVSAEGDLGKEAPYYFREIRVAVGLKGAGLDDRRKKALIDFIRNCPVHNTLRNGPAVSISLD